MKSKGTHYWLVKQEPEAFSWSDLVKQGSTEWTGVRNFQPRNNLRGMAVGDPVLFYHSVSEKQIVGIAQVSKAAYQDPTSDDPNWVCVEIKPKQVLGQPVTLTATVNATTGSGVQIILQVLCPQGSARPSSTGHPTCV